MPDAHVIFDRQTLRRRRDRAALLANESFLFTQLAERLADRLADFTRSFPLALDLGAHTGILGDTLEGRGGVQVLVQTDLSKSMLDETSGPRVVCDEEFLPFAENTFDAVLSAGSLHWVNDLPGTLAQIHRILKKDGLFLAMFPGGETLKELRASLEAAELSAKGGISPRVSPFVDVRDAGALLQRAGFSMPVADSEKLTAYYQDALTLFSDLREWGESNVLVSRQKHLARRSVLFEAAAHYAQHFKRDKGLPATFEFVAMTGWKT
jgi:NADH dehydrogenase [ubiquinone] 1 alpha subcomplex assembly factor 5